tara:strand:- start:1147 stop:1314 length:168 start_codon:yes stop_codon:yes gene_type:complete
MASDKNSEFCARLSALKQLAKVVYNLGKVWAVALVVQHAFEMKSMSKERSLSPGT